MLKNNTMNQMNFQKYNSCYFLKNHFNQQVFNKKI